MDDTHLIETGDGSHSIHSERFGVSYHSVHGAVQETQHVFIEAGLHHARARGLATIHLLEIGWGTGLNSYMSYLDNQSHDTQIHYTALEAYPISLKDAQQLNYSRLLRQDGPRLFLQFHELPWETPCGIPPRFTFTKRKMNFQNFGEKNSYDLIYFDAFAPDAQPELWEVDMMTRMHRCLRPGGVLVTYCAKGAFKRCLKALGFQVEAIPGPPGKREMTRAARV